MKMTRLIHTMWSNGPLYQVHLYEQAPFGKRVVNVWNVQKGPSINIMASQKTWFEYMILSKDSTMSLDEKNIKYGKWYKRKAWDTAKWQRFCIKFHVSGGEEVF